MIKVYSAVILLFLLASFDLSFAQAQDDQASKIYSGYFHQNNLKNKPSLWHTFFGKKPVQQEQDDPDRQCSVEFKSPVSFTHESVSELPSELSYFIRFKNAGASTEDFIKEKDALGKFVIKIYTNDEQEYSIDPEAEGKQLEINDEHHIFDTYLIYLILSQNIDHLELVSTSGDDKGKYVLDKLEIQNDD